MKQYKDTAVTQIANVVPHIFPQGLGASRYKEGESGFMEEDPYICASIVMISNKTDGATQTWTWKRGRGKAVYKGGCVHFILYKSVQNVDKGERAKKSENFADVINGRSLWVLVHSGIVLIDLENKGQNSLV